MKLEQKKGKEVKWKSVYHIYRWFIHSYVAACITARVLYSLHTVYSVLYFSLFKKPIFYLPAVRWDWVRRLNKHHKYRNGCQRVHKSNFTMYQVILCDRNWSKSDFKWCLNYTKSFFSLVCENQRCWTTFIRAKCILFDAILIGTVYVLRTNQ